MKMRQIAPNVYSIGAIDWNRRIFDAILPIPNGTTYNAYLVKGSSKTALLDTVEPHFAEGMLNALSEVERIDAIVVHHSEQDHSGALPQIMAKYPQAQVYATAKAITLLKMWFDLPTDRLNAIKDGDRLDLGDRTLTFHSMPWVHWPDTMVSHLSGENILFTCDMFGSHVAQSGLFADDVARVKEAARRYYSVIMAPYRVQIGRHLEKIASINPTTIAPSHGPVYNQPDWIIAAYKGWAVEPPHNLVVLPFITMHESTEIMVNILSEELIRRGVEVLPLDLTTLDVGILAENLIDAQTIVLGSPTVLGGAHPNVLYAAQLANMMKPKARFATIIGSLGWGGKMIEQLTAALADLKVEFLEPVLCKGIPREPERVALAGLAELIAGKHLTLPHPRAGGDEG